MKKSILFLIALLVMLPVIGYGKIAKNDFNLKAKATVFNPVTGQRKAVAIGDKRAFDGGFILESKAGAVVPNVVADFQTSLASKLVTTETSSMTLVSGTTKDGVTLNGLYGFTLDEGTSNKEYLVATCVNTACTGLTRGISAVTGSSSVAALIKEHRRGASVKITDHPLLTILSNLMNGRDTIPYSLKYDPSLIINSTNATNTLANIDYVNNVATSGVADASASIKGKSKLSSAPLVATNPIALNYEEVATTSGANKVVRASSTGKINNNFLDTTSVLNFLNPVGSVTAYASSTAPTGWLLCNGALASTTVYSALFALIGYTYGGSGLNFKLPDLSGRSITMASSTRSDADTLGESGGATTTTLTIPQIPSHTHTYTTYNSSGGATYYLMGNVYTSPSTQISMDYTGGGLPHSNLDPYIVLNYIIKY